MADPIRWGVCGAGGIARQFARALKGLPEARLAAVASRSTEKAAAFAGEFGFIRAHGDYAALAADPEVDAVYVATPHPFHLACARLMLEAGKAVLCEKPLTVNAGEAEQLVACARANRTFLMEAMWTRFLPPVRQAVEWLRAGKIGELRLLSADFGFRCSWNPQGRLLNPELGGGALLDVGVYTIALASLIFGRSPVEIATLTHRGETGVDEQSALLFGYPGGALAQLFCAVRTLTPQGARLDGTEGRITIPDFWHCTKATLEVYGGATQTFEHTHRVNGYEHEATEVMRCLRAGERESPLMLLDESIAIQRTMDEIRQRWGLRYPGE